MGFYPTTHGVFGAMADKDLAPMLAKMGPLVDRWYFTDLPTPRADTASSLEAKWRAQETRGDVASSTHASPMEAFEAAVAALAANLDAMGFFATTHAVFGAMGDKDLDPMLAKMGPLVDHWYFTDLPTPRAATAQALLQRWQALPGYADIPASTHANPQEALQAALAAAEPADRILVFGSFYTVGGVLQHGLPRLSAKHLG
jgi:folylpolyglutamate synthase/dihydropteroate synthase